MTEPGAELSVSFQTPEQKTGEEGGKMESSTVEPSKPEEKMSEDTDKKSIEQDNEKEKGKDLERIPSDSKEAIGNEVTAVKESASIEEVRKDEKPAKEGTDPSTALPVVKQEPRALDTRTESDPTDRANSTSSDNAVATAEVVPPAQLATDRGDEKESVTLKFEEKPDARPENAVVATTLTNEEEADKGNEAKLENETGVKAKSPDVPEKADQSHLHSAAGTTDVKDKEMVELNEPDPYSTDELTSVSSTNTETKVDVASKAVTVDDDKKPIVNSTILSANGSKDEGAKHKNRLQSNAKVVQEPSADPIGDSMQVDEPKASMETVSQQEVGVVPESIVEESKAVHEIIAEQGSIVEKRESIVPAPVPAEVSTVASSESPQLCAPETKVNTQEGIDDWDIPASDEEEPDGEILEGDVGEKRKKSDAVKRGYWEPPVEVIVELYRKLDKEGVLELSWKCPGRRPPSEDSDKEEEKELPEDVINEGEMEISKEEDPTEFDFDMDVDAAMTVTPRRALGSGQAQGSGKKRVARMDKVLNDIYRHRKIGSAMMERVNRTTDEEVAMETDQTGDSSSPAKVATPSRPQGKFHIRSDLDM